jgi:hypothetical protein
MVLVPAEKFEQYFLITLRRTNDVLPVCYSSLNKIINLGSDQSSLLYRTLAGRRRRDIFAILTFCYILAKQQLDCFV